MSCYLKKFNTFLCADDSGFTLVELAIVMIIIGLLIGGVLKGQQLIDNARVTSTLSQIKSYEGAVSGFMDAYGAMPGDMRNATTRIPGCVSGNNCVSGNGDGMVEIAAGLSPSWNGKTDGNDESSQVWKHLALTDFVTGVDPIADPAVERNWGESHPASSINGGFEMYFDTSMADVGSPVSGLFLRLSRTGLGNLVMGAPRTEAVKPLQAAQMDRKLDDGIAYSGTVFANNGCKTPIGTTIAPYAEQTDLPNCVVFFRVGR